MLTQSNPELLQQIQDANYKTLKQNVPKQNKKLLLGDDFNNRIKLLQASNKPCKVNIPSSNITSKTRQLTKPKTIKKTLKGSQVSQEEQFQ